MTAAGTACQAASTRSAGASAAVAASPSTASARSALAYPWQSVLRRPGDVELVVDDRPIEAVFGEPIR